MRFNHKTISSISSKLNDIQQRWKISLTRYRFHFPQNIHDLTYPTLNLALIRTLYCIWAHVYLHVNSQIKFFVTHHMCPHMVKFYSSVDCARKCKLIHKFLRAFTVHVWNTRTLVICVYITFESILKAIWKTVSWRNIMFCRCWYKKNSAGLW